MRTNRRGCGQDAEPALDLAPAELVVEGQPLGEQQRHLEALAHHRVDRQPHQCGRDALVPVFLEREDRPDAAHRHRLPVEIDGAVENLDGRNEPSAVARHQAQRIAEGWIVLVVAREKLAAIVVPSPEQFDHFVPVAPMRRPNFHSSGFLTHFSERRHRQRPPCRCPAMAAVSDCPMRSCYCERRSRTFDAIVWNTASSWVALGAKTASPCGWAELNVGADGSLATSCRYASLIVLPRPIE